MDTKTKKRKPLRIRLFVFGMLAFIPVYLYSQDNGAASPFPQEDSSLFYYYETKEKASPVFTQILKWTDSAGVLYYEVTLKRTDGVTIFKNKRCQTNQLEVQLKPGMYRYKVFVFNMLGALEQESDWLPIEIRQAHVPEIKKVSPDKLYLEDQNFTLEVNGAGFADNAEVSLRNGEKSKAIPITPTAVTENKITIDIKDPNAFLNMMLYVTVKDKSGLFTTSEAISIKYRKPLDFYCGVSYIPWIPVYDKWYIGKFNKKFYPIAGGAELGLIFLKTRYGFFGVELHSSYAKTDLSQHDMKAFTIFSSARFLYEYWFIRHMAFYMTAGGGASFMKVQTVDKRSVKSIDPMYTFGLGFRIKPVRFLYLDIAVSMDHIFMKDMQMLGILPEIGIGFRY